MCPAVEIHVVLVQEDAVVSLCVLEDLGEWCFGAGVGWSVELDDDRVSWVLTLDAELVGMVLAPAECRLDDEMEIVEVDCGWDRDVAGDCWVFGGCDCYF